MSRGTSLAVCLLLIGAATVASAAEEPSRFRRAQRLAWDGQRDEARELCREILAESPGHHDARILLGRVLAWDKRYAEARSELEEVLERRPDYADASRALADVELWDHRLDRVLAVCEAGLAHNPDDGELLYRRARALEKLDRLDDALAIARPLAEREPADLRFTTLADRLRVKSMTARAQLGYRYEDFQEFSDPWQEWNVSVRWRRSWGSIIGRVRHARRFGDGGEQFEVDAYPRLPGRMYAYLNVGWAGDEPFPRRRAGAEIYRSLGRGWEISLGARYLDFESSNVRIYTGTVGKYWGNWWISARPTHTDKALRSSVSLGLRLRRYFRGSESWLGVEGSFGDKPAFDLAGYEEGRLGSARLRVEGQLAFRRVWTVSGSVGLRDQEYGIDRRRKSVVFSIALSRAF